MCIVIDCPNPPSADGTGICMGHQRALRAIDGPKRRANMIARLGARKLHARDLPTIDPAPSPSKKADMTTPEPNPPVREKVIPRVVCTKCPAVAKVHYWRDAADYSNEIWIECHGEHVLGRIVATGWRAIEQYVGDDGNSVVTTISQNRDLLFTEVTGMSDSRVHDEFTAAERKMQEFADRAKILQMFLERKVPPTP